MISVHDDVIHLHGDCRVDDAESLVGLLQAARAPRVDLSACGHLHSAVVQVLLAFQPECVAPPGDALLATLLRRDGEAAR